MSSQSFYALVIGVDHYADYHVSGRARIAPGKSPDLVGAVNDAIKWTDLLSAGLGLPEGATRLLLAPRPNRAPDAIAPRADVKVRTATSADIVEGVRWLGRRLAEADNTVGPDVPGHQRPAGLIVFSGHGITGKDPGRGPLGLNVAICGADLTREDGQITGAISVRKVQAVLARNLAANLDTPSTDGDGDALASRTRTLLNNVTVVLDCCYEPTKGWDPEAQEGSTPVTDVNNLCRYVLATEPFGTAYEVESMGRWHGALTLGIITVLEQWRVVRGKNSSWFHVSTGDVLYRARALLTALGVPQSPLLAAPPRVNMLPFLRPGVQDVDPVNFSRTPDRPRPKEQILTPETAGFSAMELRAFGPGTAAGGELIAVVVVCGSGYDYSDGASTTYWFGSGREHWFPVAVDKPKLFNTSGACTITSLSWTLSQDATPWGPTGQAGSGAMYGYLQSLGLESVTPSFLTEFSKFRTSPVAATSNDDDLSSAFFGAQVDGGEVPWGNQLGFNNKSGGTMVQLSSLCWLQRAGTSDTPQFFNGMGLDQSQDLPPDPHQPALIPQSGDRWWRGSMATPQPSAPHLDATEASGNDTVRLVYAYALSKSDHEEQLTKYSNKAIVDRAPAGGFSAAVHLSPPLGSSGQQDVDLYRRIKYGNGTKVMKPLGTVTCTTSPFTFTDDTPISEDQG